MRKWTLRVGDPLSLVIAADARLSNLDYLNDQIWELRIQQGEPTLLSVSTSFGLRVPYFRIFPRFIQEEVSITDPKEFDKPVEFIQIYPNLITLAFSPFPSIDVEADYWVPESKNLCIFFKLHNLNAVEKSITVEWIVEQSHSAGVEISAISMESTIVLAGKFTHLSPVIFLSNGQKPGSTPKPSLTLNLDIPPMGSRRSLCSHSALEDIDSSFSNVQKHAFCNWEAEKTCIELTNKSFIEIYTGNHDMDAALMLSQKVAYNLIYYSPGKLPHASFVLSRNPDHGFSPRSDGMDYDHQWSGQSAFEAYYLSKILLPGGTELLEGILKNFVSVQKKTGFIDLKPGLGGQKSNLLCSPILASLAWEIFECSNNYQFIQDVFHPLLNFVHLWFDHKFDHDRDGIPEWDHPFQTGLEDSPNECLLNSWLRSEYIHFSENPALSALLLKECYTLIKMARILNLEEMIEDLYPKVDRLHSSIQVSWDESEALYQDLDRDTHICTKGEELGTCYGEGFLHLERLFENPIRIQIHINADIKRQDTRIYIHGIQHSGFQRVEHISAQDIYWDINGGLAVSRNLYSSLHKIEFKGLEQTDLVRISSAGFNNPNLSLLLPIWAQIPDINTTRLIVDKNLKNPHKFWRPYGLPTYVLRSESSIEDFGNRINLLWNVFIGEGLLNYGYDDFVAELATKLLSVIILNLKNQQNFRQYYNSENGSGLGAKNYLTGLTPLNLFLSAVGIKVYSHGKIYIRGINPFPHPVIIKYKGLVIHKYGQSSRISFPNGQKIEINDPAPQLITM